jgi:hypothetical protein
MDKIKAWLWAVAGNSKTIAVAYAVQLLALIDEFKVVDWSALFGVERGGRIASIMSLLMIGLRLVTTGSTSFKPG